ncbi:MAG: arginine N-succinyltransferase [Thiohalomonadaceae bacterium]
MHQYRPVGGKTFKRRRGLGGWWWALILLLLIIVSVGLSLWLVQSLLMPKQLEPVSLSQPEQRQLEQKMQRLLPEQAEQAVQPQPYLEDPASREILLSERELNALIARNPELAQRLAIHLDQDLASITLLLALDPQFPLLGGQTLKIRAGLELRYLDGRPVMILRGVSLWGVPLPNAWLGERKHIDLVAEFGEDDGFWQGLQAGIADLEVQHGQLRLRLQE